MQLFYLPLTHVAISRENKWNPMTLLNFTLSMRESPISAWEMSSPFELQIFMVQVGGGPVLAMVPAVVRVLTLNPMLRLFSPVW